MSKTVIVTGASRGMLFRFIMPKKDLMYAYAVTKMQICLTH